jgi:hypothetical protein
MYVYVDPGGHFETLDGNLTYFQFGSECGFGELNDARYECR